MEIQESEKQKPAGNYVIVAVQEMKDGKYVKGSRQSIRIYKMKLSDVYQVIITSLKHACNKAAKTRKRL